MSLDAPLFGDDQPDPPPTGNAIAPVADWQVDLLRRALDARGLTDMADRQRAIEDAAGHAVASLRALTGEEAIRVLNRLAATRPKSSTASAWDERDGDTWIDRL